jgi:Ni,Fe-hydrogenase maturation factor
MSEFASEDFEAYSRLFSLHATKTIELMRILEEKITVELEMVNVRPKDLFRMFMDMSYEVDRLYKKEKNIKDEYHFIDTLVTKNETIAEMRTMLQDEFKRYLGGSDD